MEKNHRRMKPCATGEIGDTVDLHPATWDMDNLHSRGMRLVGRGISVDRSGNGWRLGRSSRSEKSRRSRRYENVDFQFVPLRQRSQRKLA